MKKKQIPSNVVQKIIADILIERGNKISKGADIMAEEQEKESGVTTHYVGELESTASGTYVLADDVLSGEIPIKEALNSILNPDEKELAKNRCEDWIQNNEIER